ncbi:MULTISPECIES: peroxiredoxin [Prochlorococcus]|uniref:peroxiredoxin n=1 Tax=Prochlorococcus TaxID=1218 RepID=UPI0005338523|nr:MULTISPECIES: peroxiredoxin [Prochlorococcus]KGG12487.1 Alkyl hydroperoxide reductase subunit C-like protein [Prochlorococcus sp. MIT 0601]
MNFLNRFFFRLIASLIVFLIFSNSIYAVENITPDIGNKAPEFILEGYSSQFPEKNLWKLSDLSNTWVVLYFYPKDFTNGCTIEAKGFDKLNKNFINRNTTVIGISNDQVNEHESFCSKESLSIVLLTDEDGKVSEKYGSWNPPYSKRNTFLIDPDGNIKYKWLGVIPSKHPQEVYKKLIELEK